MLSALVRNQQPVADYIAKLVDDKKSAKTIKNYWFVIKAIVGSAKDVSTRIQLFTWWLVITKCC